MVSNKLTRDRPGVDVQYFRKPRSPARAVSCVGTGQIAVTECTLGANLGNGFPMPMSFCDVNNKRVCFRKGYQHMNLQNGPDARREKLNKKE